ncbi:putative S-adenosylmethionine-dependent methyltransferase [Corchorus olitorius]|uniref:S-adenosylmethionine-dependent methyltransferase n=1 Tax=Corchorus olitorius TaxID=93759 RepID=A0A1R3HXH2_9ROSI|nr:putative S-adenosylmethionine-dependent methyltransferase [Corchorus olitorius]
MPSSSTRFACSIDPPAYYSSFLRTQTLRSRIHSLLQSKETKTETEEAALHSNLNEKEQAADQRHQVKSWKHSFDSLELAEDDTLVSCGALLVNALIFVHC